MKQFSLIVLTILCIKSLVLAQVEVYTLGRAIEVALDQSFQIRSLGLTLESADFGLKAAKGRFKTNAELNMQVPYFEERVQQIRVANQLPVFNTLGTTRFQSILNVNQPLPTDGVLSLRSRLYHLTESVYLDESASDIRRKEFFTSVRLDFSQPLFALNRLKTGYERANLTYEKAQKQFKRTELAIVFDVTAAFYSLYRATRSVEIAQGDVGRSKEAFELARRKFEAGLIPEVEALQTEVDYATSQNNLLSVQGRLKRQADNFKQLIGVDLNENVGVDTRIDYQPFEVDEGFAIEQALQNRTEIREREIERRLAEITVKEADEVSDFRLQLNAFWDITGVSEPELDDTGLTSLFNSSIDDLQRRPQNKGITLELEVPLWDWGVNKSEVSQARSQLAQADLILKENRILVKQGVRAVISSLYEAQNRLEVLKKSEELSEKSFAISLSRFENGSITGQELTLDRDRVTAARTDFLNAYITYQLAVAELKRQTLWDFENRQSLVE